MKTILFFTALGFALVFPFTSGAQRDVPANSDQKPTPPSSAPAEKTAPSPAELEAKFKSLLANAKLTGRWCLIQDGTLTPEKEDQYTITGVSKLNGDTWIIKATIEYNGKSIVAPIPVKVKWAGETPVITLDNLPIPGSGVYSARVLLHEGTYAGTWSGGNLKGLLSGIITQE